MGESGIEGRWRQFHRLAKYPAVSFQGFGGLYESDKTREQLYYFLLFFGVAALEAFQTGNRVKAVFWLAIGFVFLVADNLTQGTTRNGVTRRGY